MKLGNRYLNLLLVSGIAVAVAGRSSGGGGETLAGIATSSNFATVNTDAVSVGLGNERNRNIASSSVGLVAYLTGLDTTKGAAVSAAGVRDGANVGRVQTIGVTIYDAQYNFGYISNVARTSTRIGGIQGQTRTQPIELTANFDAGTLTWQRPDLTVLDTIAGSTLNESVVVTVPSSNINTPINTVNDALNGQVGSTGVIGAFHGRNETSVVAGGFVGTARP